MCPQDRRLTWFAGRAIVGWAVDRDETAGFHPEPDQLALGERYRLTVRSVVSIRHG
jgi:hypothetical protein